MTESTDTKTYPYQEGGYKILGPQCFTLSDDTVISWQGENYYRACGLKVADLHDGGMSTCVTRTGHPWKSHEDYDGRIYHEVHGFDPDIFDMPRPSLMPTGIPVTKSGIQDAWDSFILTAQQSGDAQSIEFRIIMACLRAVNEALPMDEENIAAVKPGLVTIEVDDQMIPAVVVDEVDGPCEKCGGEHNEWRSENQGDKAVLVCTTCGNVRVDR